MASITQKYLLGLIILLNFLTLQSQSLTTTQTEHLYKSGQLWGHLKYFHPYLQYKKIPFDSAYAAVVPELMNAKSAVDFSNALNKWLSILDDPITFAEVKKETIEVLPFIAHFRSKDEVGILTLAGGLSDWGDVFEKLESIADSLKTINNLIIDCRGLPENFGILFQYSDLQYQLFKGTISTLGSRSVSHEGFAPEIGNSSGDYHTYFKNIAPKEIIGQLNTDLPTVFIVASNSGIPEIALAMRKAGKAAILSDGPMADSDNATIYEIVKGVKVSIRTNEILTSHVNPDFISKDQNPSVLIEKALDIIAKNEFKINNTIANDNFDFVPKDPKYSKERYPNIGYRAIAAAKINTVIHYFFPNKKLMDSDWDSITKLFISPIVLAKDSVEYQYAVHSYYANIQDGHGYIGGSLINKFINGGPERAAMTGSIVEGKFVITNVYDDSLAIKLEFQKGDIITKRNGKDVTELINTFKKYRAHSNDVTGGSYASSMVCVGQDLTEGTFTILKQNGKSVDVKVPFNNKYSIQYRTNTSGRKNQKMMRFLNPDIGYVDLDRLDAASVDDMFEMFKNTKAIVFDMRGYPNGTAWSIAPRLTNKSVIAAKFTRLDQHIPKILDENSDISNTETWTTFFQNTPVPDPLKKRYLGKTVMLINEETQSQAEHTGLFLKAANGTKFIGSQTAGANGDVTNFTIPGNLTLNFSGQTVWFPDGTQLQKTGLKPDIFVRPTIKGIRAGKDEVLERAIKYLLKNK
jgi:C-terminal processing protease CtpA/Prc